MKTREVVLGSLLVWAGANAQCADNGAWSVVIGGQTKNCAWVGGNVGARCGQTLNTAGNPNTSAKCPVTCNACPPPSAPPPLPLAPPPPPATCPLIFESGTVNGACQDDATFSRNLGGVTVTCNYVALLPATRCQMALGFGPMAQKTSDLCPASCGECKECSASTRCIAECNNYACGHPKCKPQQIFEKCSIDTAAAESISDAPTADASPVPIGLHVDVLDNIELELSSGTMLLAPLRSCPSARHGLTRVASRLACAISSWQPRTRCTPPHLCELTCSGRTLAC